MEERLAHFRILDKLGEGGMGVVHRAHDEKLDRDVALKFLTLDTPDRRTRFLREARLAAAVTHPNIATIYEVGEVGDRVYIAMELVAGRSLRSVIEGGKLPVERAVKIARSIALGLARAHETGIVHRDLKPENVMIGHDGEVKLLDFGIARDQRVDVLGKTEAPITKEGAIIGTVGYMAPEQATGQAVDARADILSLGVVLFEMLAGELPFAGTSGLEVLIASTRDPPKELRDVPEHLATLVRWCLEKNPDDRCPSARAFIDALEPPSAASPLARTVAEDALPRVERSGRDGVEAPRSRRWLVAAPIAAVTAAAAFAIALAPPKEKPALPAADAAGPVSLLDAPRPKCKDDAADAYVRGLAAFHDGSWSAAHDAFTHAVAIDPACAEAQFRLAQTSWGFVSTGDARTAYREATLRKNTMSARDRALVEAYEPFFGRDPPDASAFADRMRALADTRRNDAEIQSLACRAVVDHDPKAALPYGQRAVDLDPTYGDAWQDLALASRRNGDRDGAIEKLGKCIDVTTSTDCLTDRIDLLRQRNDCPRVEGDAKLLLVRAPSDQTGSHFLAIALAGQGKRDAAFTANDQGWSFVPEPRRWTRFVDRALLASRFGDFDGASRALSEMDAWLEGKKDLAPWVARTMIGIDLEIERGNVERARKRADEFVAKRAAFIEGADYSLSPRVWWYEGWLIGMQSRLGLDRAEQERRSSVWVETRNAKRIRPRMRFGLLRALGVRDAAEATAALGDLPPDDQERWIVGNEAVGRMLVLAGQNDLAVAHLERATGWCDGFEDAFAETRAWLELGAAVERTDPKRACDAYAKVLERWSAKTSVSARQAEAARKQLKCP